MIGNLVSWAWGLDNSRSAGVSEGGGQKSAREVPARLPAKKVSDLGLLVTRALLGVFCPLRHIYELFNSTHHSMESSSLEPIFLGEKT